jgi:Na+/H+-translocating membrane pyrophosphatase
VTHPHFSALAAMETAWSRALAMGLTVGAVAVLGLATFVFFWAPATAKEDEEADLDVSCHGTGATGRCCDRRGAGSDQEGPGQGRQGSEGDDV